MNNQQPYNPQIHHRRSIRLKGYDYSQAGLYFITICCQKGLCLLGEIEINMPILDTSSTTISGEMILNDAGRMVETAWLSLPNRFANISLHEYVVMPNHFHGILEITNSRDGKAPTDKTVGDMIDTFKSITTVEYIRGVKNLDWQPFDGKLWQRNYYEHIIRDDQFYYQITEYIVNNPAKWNEDKFYNNSVL